MKRVTPRKAVRKTGAKPPAVRKKAAKAAPPAAKKPAPKKIVAGRKAQLDWSAFPAESLTHLERWICLACVANVFIKVLKLAPRTAMAEIRSHAPTLEELNAEPPVRPYFLEPRADGKCPYCGAPPRAHARLRIVRIESGKATDAARRALVKSLPSNGSMAIVEEKATHQHAFFDWLEHVSTRLDFEHPRWLLEVAIHYLGRKFPKVNWEENLGDVRWIQRSRRLEEGWELDQGRLFLAPMLFDELLFVHYLVSRSQKAGGLTLERRYTLPELFSRLRHSGYLRFMGVKSQNPGDALEELVAALGGGEGSMKFYYVIDRREFLEKVSAMKK